MRMKSYFAESIEAAMAQASKELGEDAILMNSRRSEPDLRHLGTYEVVCALAPEIRPLEPSRNAAAASALSHEMTRLREQMESLARMILRSGASFSGLAARPELAKIYAALCDAEVDVEVAQDIVLRLSLHTEPAEPAGALARMARSELASFILTSPTLGVSTTRIVALVGPPGSGKTTSLVKLAIRECLAQRRPCSLFTIDTVRIAAADQLRSYAAILGVPFQVLETPAALSLALESLHPTDPAGCHTIFVDTPGFAATEMDDARMWAEAFRGYSGIDIHLVLPASMRTADQKRIAAQYEIFSPSKLLFTKLDETEACGGIVSLSLALRKPISFLSSGQQIPEDLEGAAAGQIAARILYGLAEEEAAAAAAAAAA